MKTRFLLFLIPLYTFAQMPQLPERRPADLRIFFSNIRESPFEDIQLQVYDHRAIWNRTTADVVHTHGERQLTNDDLDHLYGLLKSYHVDKFQGNPVKGAASSLQVSWNGEQSKILLVNFDAYSVQEPYGQDWVVLVERLRVFHRWTESDK